MTLAITEALTTIAEAERRLKLVRSEDASFFPEWRVDLPELSVEEQLALVDLRRRYLYQRSEGQLLEGTVMLLLVSPLLTIAGFYDPPFLVRAEESVVLRLDDGEDVLSGRIDVLVLVRGLWAVVLESKKTALSVWAALPQVLAYLMGNPEPKAVVFGMVTNGDEIMFVKVDRGQYAVSRGFAPFASEEELDLALRILKRCGMA